MNPNWLNRYRICIRFASQWNSDHRYDIVHDAYIRYLDRTGDDLFSIDLKNESSYLYTVIKRAFFHWSYRERKSDKYQYFHTDFLTSKFDDPHDALVGKELYQDFYRKLFFATRPTDKRHYRTEKSRMLPMEIFRLKAEGHTQTEIALDLNVSKQLVNQYVKKIQELAWLNPINGSNLVVKRVITDYEWGRMKHKEDYELDDENEYYILQRHKESGEGLLVRISTPDDKAVNQPS